MYINNYVLAVPEQNKAAYTHLAEVFAEVAADYGVLELFETWEVEVPDGKLTDYRKAVRAEPGEKIVCSWAIWPDKATADKAHDEMFNDPRFADMQDMPFDGKRMILGGFEPIVSFRKG